MYLKFLVSKMGLIMYLSLRTVVKIKWPVFIKLYLGTRVTILKLAFSHQGHYDTV